MTKTGIYQITNKINGHKYIGSAVNIAKRWKTHLWALRNGNHHSVYLQRAFNKYGEENIDFSILLECPKEDLVTKEQEFIDLLHPEYNICKIAGSPLGIRHSEETRAKVSASLIGNKRSVGKLHTEEWKQNNALMMLGNKHSLGIKQSEETRMKKSIACKGKHLGVQSWLGKTHTEETKEKMSAAQKGIPKTEEHKQHMREARKRYFERKRAAAVEQSI